MWKPCSFSRNRTQIWFSKRSNMMLLTLYFMKRKNPERTLSSLRGLWILEPRSEGISRNWQGFCGTLTYNLDNKKPPRRLALNTLIWHIQFGILAWIPSPTTIVFHPLPLWITTAILHQVLTFLKVMHNGSGHCI